MTPEEFIETVVHPWANTDDAVHLVEPLLNFEHDEAWSIEFEDGSEITVVVNRIR